VSGPRTRPFPEGLGLEKALWEQFQPVAYALLVQLYEMLQTQQRRVDALNNDLEPDLYRMWRVYSLNNYVRTGLVKLNTSL
jgi:hypothetical protein